MVDMIVVGNVMGDVGLSAVAVGGDISNMLLFLGMGFSNAGQVMIAQYMGAGKRRQIGQFIGTMTTVLTMVALVLSVIGIVFCREFLSWMNAPAESFQEALAYSNICIMGMVFIYGYNIMSAILRGLGDAKHPFVFVSVTAVMNVILDIVFVAVWSMGAGGAALATVVSQCFSFVFSVLFLY
ncbi:MAG: polysaccharide biosynthesis C-terminal domain-containing protein, partial [Clostridiales bacterium]|nr:polysaccharide biosynthesis C-terminal domain-containing protein [Clostridiales bacterium]